MKRADTVIKTFARATVDFYVQARIPKSVILQQVEEIADTVLNYKNALSHRTGAYATHPSKSELETYLRDYIEKNAK